MILHGGRAVPMRQFIAQQLKVPKYRRGEWPSRIMDILADAELAPSSDPAVSE